MLVARHESANALALRSFRDPAGCVYRCDGRVLRAVRDQDLADFQAFLQTAFAAKATTAGKLVRTVPLSEDDIPERLPRGDIYYEHERIPFPSYPHEWPPEMLAAAAELTLELFQSALDEGFGLKDGTPYNVLFRGSAPVFVDVLSFERRCPDDPSWLGYGQFVQTFLLPLLAHKYFGIDPRMVFATRREGLDPEMVYSMAGFFRRLSPKLLSLVTLPTLLSGKAAKHVSYRQKRAKSPEQARFILDGLLANCRRQMRRLAPQHTRSSVWSAYLDSKSLYTSEQLAQKERFVVETIRRARPRTVLDVGANEGKFSFLAAQHGASVVAIDSDPVVAGTIWRRAHQERLDVLPLIVDLTRPTPALGWRNQESDSFLARVRQMEGAGFDLVLMLAVIHHMLVTERVPLPELLSLASELTQDFALIEFIGTADPMFKRILRGREALHSGLTQAAFEAAAAPFFDLVRSEKIDGLDRCLYLFRRRERK